LLNILTKKQTLRGNIDERANMKEMRKIRLILEVYGEPLATREVEKSKLQEILQLPESYWEHLNGFYLTPFYWDESGNPIKKATPIDTKNKS